MMAFSDCWQLTGKCLHTRIKVLYVATISDFEHTMGDIETRLMNLAIVVFYRHRWAKY